jgi:nucleoside phosphorylase
VDLGIVIALKEEFREFMALLPVKHDIERGEVTGQFGYLFEHPASRHQCVVTFIGEMDPTPAALHTERLIARWSPRSVVMLGIAAGLHSDVRVGDVVIASQVDSYLSSAKALPGSESQSFAFSFGGKVYQGDFDFLTQVRNFEFAQAQAFSLWRQTSARLLEELVPEEGARAALVREGLVRNVPELLDVHLASGPVVGAAQQFTQWLRDGRDRTLKALDMESAGLMEAALSRIVPARTLIIRGISDYGDERKSQLDAIEGGGLRRYAMRNATHLLWALLESGVLPRAGARGTPGVAKKAASRAGREREPRPTKASLRKLLMEVLPDIGSFEAFCSDYFEDVHRRFSGGMDRVQRETLLLTREKPSVVLERLRQALPDKVAENEEVLEYEP